MRASTSTLPSPAHALRSFSRTYSAVLWSPGPLRKFFAIRRLTRVACTRSSSLVVPLAFPVLSNSCPITSMAKSPTKVSTQMRLLCTEQPEQSRPLSFPVTPPRKPRTFYFLMSPSVPWVRLLSVRCSPLTTNRYLQYRDRWWCHDRAYQVQHDQEVRNLLHILRQSTGCAHPGIRASV